MFIIFNDIISSQDIGDYKLVTYTTISKYINERLDYMNELYFLDDSKVQELKDGNQPIILVKYYKIFVNYPLF